MVRKTGVAAIILISAALAVGPLVAGEAILPGAACVKWTSGDPTPLLSYSELHNPSSTAWLRVDCPVVRTDFDSFLHDAGVEGAWVRMVDRHYTSNGSCRLISYSRNTDGTASFWATGTQFTAGSGNQAQVLNTGGLGGENGASHLYFSCQIPPSYAGNSSSLVTYYANQ